MSLTSRMTSPFLTGKKNQKYHVKEIWPRRLFGWLIQKYLPEELATRLLREFELDY